MHNKKPVTTHMSLRRGWFSVSDLLISSTTSLAVKTLSVTTTDGFPPFLDDQHFRLEIQAWEY